MKFPEPIIAHLIQEAFTAGWNQGPSPNFNEPEEPYYIIIGNGLHGAYLLGLSHIETFDPDGLLEFLINVPYTIEDGDLVGVYTNVEGTQFNVYWRSSSSKIDLIPRED